MGRCSVLAVLVVATAAPAHAGPKKKVLIESKPPGASVYVGTIEDGERCKTPCTIEVDNDANVIVDLAGYKPKIEQLVFKRTDRPPFKRSYKLLASVGNLTVEGPAGATVLIDNVEKGKIPFDDEVPAGAHIVQVKLDGSELYSKSVEIPEDGDFKINVPPKAKGKGKDIADKEPDNEDNGDKTDDTTPQITKPAEPKQPRDGKLFAMSAAFSVGFRDFAYKNVNPNTMRNDLGPESEGGQMLAGVLAEVWPGTLAGIRPLRGFALVVRAQLGVNSQAVVEDTTNNELNATTFWRSFEASARQRWQFGSVGVEVTAGYAYDQHQFEGDETQIDLVPDALYQSLKIGGGASIKLGSLQPYLSVENRIVMSGGPLEDRFTDGAAVNGFRGAAGIGWMTGHLTGRVEGSLTRYSWTFTQGDMTDTDGATDDIKQVSVFFGYAY